MTFNFTMILQVCMKFKSCRGKGLHCHHPRDCFYYLRDNSVEELQRLLKVDIFRSEPTNTPPFSAIKKGFFGYEYLKFLGIINMNFFSVSVYDTYLPEKNTCTYQFLKDLNVVIIGNFLFLCLYNVCDVSQKVTKEFQVLRTYLSGSEQKVFHFALLQRVLALTVYLLTLCRRKM